MPLKFRTSLCRSNKYSCRNNRSGNVCLYRILVQNYKRLILGIMNELNFEIQQFQIPYSGLNLYVHTEAQQKLPFSSLSSWLNEVLISSPFDNMEMLVPIEPFTQTEHKYMEIAQEGGSNITQQASFTREDSFAIESNETYSSLRSQTQTDQQTQGLSTQTFKSERAHRNINQKSGLKSLQSKNRAKVLKNFLTCLKRSALLLKRPEFQRIEDQTVRMFLKSENKTNRLEFVQIFQNQQARAIFAQLFSSKVLYRQLQLSVIRSQNRQFYLNELTLMKKALIEERLPNL